MNNTNRKILLTGVTGQVGTELFNSLHHFAEVIPTIAPGEHFLPGALTMDLMNPDSIKKVISEIKPTLIVNPAAYTAVDKAEDEPEAAMKINGAAPKIMAAEAKKINAGLIHFSTDYVYDGTGEKPFTEKSNTAPQNIYGKSKLIGDTAILNSGIKHYILRTSWVYGIIGENFVKSMLRLSLKKESLNIINDQIGAPTSARTLSDITTVLISKSIEDDNFFKEKSGVYHVVNSGYTSWFGFAKAIFALADKYKYKNILKSINPILSEQYKTRAKRPLNSRLSCKHLTDNFNISPCNWNIALENAFPLLLKFL